MENCRGSFQRKISVKNRVNTPKIINSISYKKAIKVLDAVMSCYLLLIILLCCSKNENKGCKTRCEDRRDRSFHSCCGENRREDGCQVPPVMPRNQFPFLESERESCGCEGKSN